VKEREEATCNIVVDQYHQPQCHPSVIPCERSLGSICKTFTLKVQIKIFKVCKLQKYMIIGAIFQSLGCSCAQ